MFKVEVIHNGGSYSVYVYGEKSLLNELEQRSILINHNCRVGHCGACIATLKSGQVQHQPSLYPQNESEILLCQAKPVSDIVILLNV